MKRLAIIGTHPRTRDHYEWNDGAHVWLFNEAVSNPANLNWARRADAIFQMHAPVIWRNPNNRNDPGHYQWLRTQTDVNVIYMQDKYDEVPASAKYPLDEIRAMLSDDNNHFLSSSVAMAIALGIYLHYDAIDIYGVAMESNTEYQFQREGVAFWIGFAEGRGIRLKFHDKTFRCLVYGYEGFVTLDYADIENRINALAPMLEQYAADYTVDRRKLDEMILAFSTDASAENEKELLEHVVKIKKQTIELGKLDGAIQENRRYKSKADAMLKAADAFSFSRQEFETNAASQSKQTQNIDRQVAAIGSRLDMVHTSIKNTPKNSKKRADLKTAYMQLMLTYLQSLNQVGLLIGAAGENYAYMSKLDGGIRAAGGQKSLEVMTNA